MSGIDIDTVSSERSCWLSYDVWVPNSRLFMTVPTAGKHPELLNELIGSCGLPLDQIVIVETKSGIDLPSGVVRIHDFDSPNIQRWWNLGIEASIARGASTVAVLNDDIRVNSDTLPRLLDQLLKSRATIASPSRPGIANKRYTRPLVPYSPRIWGCIWMLDTQSGLRPDQRYAWWYGDEDLDIRARKNFNGVVTVDVYYEHYFAGEGTSQNPFLQALAEKDAQTYQHDHARLLTLSRWVRKLPWVNRA